MPATTDLEQIREHLAAVAHWLKRELIAADGGLAMRLLGDEVPALLDLVAGLRQELDEARARLERVDEALRSAGIEYPLGGAGVTDLAAMATGRLEELQAAEAEQNRLSRELEAAQHDAGAHRWLHQQVEAERDRLLDVYRAAEQLVECERLLAAQKASLREEYVTCEHQTDLAAAVNAYRSAVSGLVPGEDDEAPR